MLRVHSSFTEIELLLTELACKNVERRGLDPTIKPGSQALGKLLRNQCTHQRKLMFPMHYFNDKNNAGRPLMLWTPPPSEHPEDNEKLAEILNLMVSDADSLTPEEARTYLAMINEKIIETEAAKHDIQLIECRATISSVYHMLASMDSLHPHKIEEGVYKVLTCYHIELCKDTANHNLRLVTR